jgi:uncharacterized protein YqeY
MFDKIKSDLTTAMKERDKFKLDVIRMLKTAVQNEQIAKMHELSDDEILTVIKREVKKRESSKEEYAKYGKLETVESLTKEIEILSVYLPEEMSEDALMAIIDETIAEVGVTSMKEMGAVIETVAAKVGAAADMSKVSKIVKEKLS